MTTPSYYDSISGESIPDGSIIWVRGAYAFPIKCIARCDEEDYWECEILLDRCPRSQGGFRKHEIVEIGKVLNQFPDGRIVSVIGNIATHEFIDRRVVPIG